MAASSSVITTFAMRVEVERVGVKFQEMLTIPKGSVKTYLSFLRIDTARSYGLTGK
jgi:hypothetical protein